MRFEFLLLAVGDENVTRGRTKTMCIAVRILVNIFQGAETRLISPINV